MVRVCSVTWTVTTVWAWVRPRESFCLATRMTPLLEARRCTVTGSTEGRGGGPAGRAPRSLRAWSQLGGLGRMRSSSRMSGSKKHQGGVFDADGGPAAADDFCG